MMKKTILTLVFALSAIGVGVSAQDTQTTPGATKEQKEVQTTTVKDSKSPEALGMDMTKHSTANVPHGGVPKSLHQAVGVVKN